jgi:LysR family transcriptional regulator, low CO2-responsive transcriptional regulator
MRYSQWRAFDAVAREGSFSRAAVRLGITQPAVTLQIKALETACSVALLRRDGRRVTPTDAGRNLLAMTRRMFEIEAEMRAFLGATTALKRGVVRLSADGPHIALDLVARFRARHPGVKVMVGFGNAGTVWKDLQEERADAIVIANPPRDHSIQTVPLLRQSLMALLPRDHALAGRRHLRLADLRSESLVLREVGSNTRRTLERAFRRAGLRPQSMLELGSREAVREAVAMRLGVGFLFEREAIDDARSVAVRLGGIEASSFDTLAFRRSDGGRTLIAALLRIAGELAADAPVRLAAGS